MQTKTITTAAKTTKRTAKPAAAKKPAKPKAAKKADKPEQPAPPRGLPLAIALDKLTPDAANVRTDAGDITELTASIAAHGLIQPLTVRPEIKEKGGESHPTGRYLVVAGGRRLRALLRLAGQRKIPKDAGVTCVIRAKAGEAEAREVSLAENVERLPMNAADEHAAFAKLADAGMSAADIAGRFGIHRRRVEQRLALGRIAPDLLDELRKGAMSAGLAQVLTLTADHDRQREAWRQCRGGWNQEVTARRLLTETAMSLDDPLLRLVGRDAYEKAGGAVRADLFSKQEEGEGFAEDAALVRRLAAGRLDAEAERVKGEGWAFVIHELQPDADPYAYRCERPERREPTKDEQQRTDEIEAELAAMDEQGWDDATPEGRAVGERYERLDAEATEMEARREEWTPEQRARCGVFLAVGTSGRMGQRRGLVDPAYDAEQRAKAQERYEREREAVTAAATPGTAVTPGGGAKEAEAADGAEFSRALVTRLTKARTEALRASMIENPAASADLLVAHLCDRMFYATHFASRDPLPLEADIRAGRDDFTPGLGRPDPSRGSGETDQPTEAQRVFYDALQAWRSRMPQTPDTLPAFVAGLSAEDRTGLLALLAAASVNAVDEAANAYRGKSDESIRRAAAFVGCDVHQWWRPTAAGVFDGMTKAGIAAAVAEALPDQPAKANALASMKKSDAARKAEALVKDAGWLPLPLRPAHHPQATRPAGDAADDAPAVPMKLAA